nr:e3 ubiquitin-protein ligase complex slx8-rfp subunit slx8 [Quercus suber]
MLTMLSSRLWDSSSHAHDASANPDPSSQNHAPPARPSSSDHPSTSIANHSLATTSITPVLRIIHDLPRPTGVDHLSIHDLDPGILPPGLRDSEEPAGSDDHASVTAPGHFGYYPSNLWNHRSTHTTTPPVRQDPSGGGIEERDMASLPRRGPDESRPRVVDLTDDVSDPSASSSQKRKRVPQIPSGDENRASKRGKMSTTYAGADIEEIDLSNDHEVPSVEEALLQSQQQAAIKSQQEEPIGPQRIGRHTCIICMEPFTNLTTTVCGHPFCHECLIQALMAGEKNSDSRVGNCPVCRRPLKRHTKSATIVPILFMKKSTFKDKTRQPDEMYLH